MAGPGPGSGKLATCLSQVYHEHRLGRPAGYAKFETFPIWNLPLKHPVNVAYEAATVELRDVNLIDPFHLSAYGTQAINYNRDVDAFPLVSRIMERITGRAGYYKSPTDMGVNRAGFAIVDDALVRAAAGQEVIRRYFRYACEYAVGLVEREDAERAALLMTELGLKAEDRTVVAPAREAAARGEADGSRPCRHFVRRGHRPARRDHRDRAELRADARGVGGGAERGEAPVTAAGRDSPAHARRHGLDHEHEEGCPEDGRRQPGPR